MKYFMNVETGSVDTYDGWFYENENGETVNAVDLGEVVEVIKNQDGDWIELLKVKEMTREQVVERMGLEMVESAESDNCDFTNRVMNGTAWDGWTEFAGYSKANEEGERVVAYYYQKNEDLDATEDLGSLDWEIDHYEIA